jgi:replicative DNA helicase
VSVASNPTGYDAGLPANVDAEKTILGAVLLDNQAGIEAFAVLRPDDFSLDSHKRIGRGMKRLIDQGSTVDIITLGNYLASNHEIETIGGVSYLASLTEGLPRRPVIDEYIRILKDKSLLRQIMLTCGQTIALAANQSDPALDVAAGLESTLEKITASVQPSDQGKVENFIVDTFAEINREYCEQMSRRIPSGNAWYDTKTGGGYRHGRIALVAARPNVGKTPWGIQSVAYNCQRGRKCVFFSLEMEKHEVLRYFIPYVVDVTNMVVMNPHMQTPEQNALINQAANSIVEWPLEIYDGDMDIEQICYVIARATRKGEEVLFVLDHFGLIAGGDRKDTRNRYNEHSSRLRRKMKHTNGALVALCQLRKVNREYADKPPIADDIKETSNLYEDAYSALIIHRGIDAETRRMSRETFLDLCKLRGGGDRGSTKGKFDTRRLCFDADPDLYENDDDNYFA